MTKVYLCSPWIPAEWVRAHQLEPRGIWFSPGLGGAVPADTAGVCNFAHAVRQRSEAEPEAAFVYATHCDQLRRSFDDLAPGDRNFLFHIPACPHSPGSPRLFAAELERFGRFLVRLGGRSPSAADLTRVIQQGQDRRGRLARQAGAVGASRLVQALAAEMETETPDEHFSGPPGAAMPGHGRVPLALIGGPMPREQWPQLEMIERLGGRIVLMAAEPGERNLWSDSSAPPAGGAAGLPDLARDYFDHIVDVFQRPNTRLYEWLEKRLRPRGVRGILLWHYTWCDLWRAETQTLRERFGLPLLQLEADGPAAQHARSAGRLEAFLESLQ